MKDTIVTRFKAMSKEHGLLRLMKVLVVDTVKVATYLTLGSSFYFLAWSFMHGFRSVEGWVYRHRTTLPGFPWSPK